MYSWYHLEQNKDNSYLIVGFAPTPCIILFKICYQIIITTNIKNQVVEKPLGKRGDSNPLKQNANERRLIIEERLVNFKKMKVKSQNVHQIHHLKKKSL